jgi:glucose uptake protein GlcU
MLSGRYDNTVFIIFNYLCLIAMKFHTQRIIGAIAILLVIMGFFTESFAQDKFEKAEFYKVMSTGNVTAIDNEIVVVQSSVSPNKEGYEGALLMKKAGLVLITGNSIS